MNRILNFGSINIDYVYEVPRFVQPGETLSSSALRIYPGGKGLNQSVALARAGGDVFHAGKTAPEAEGVVKTMAEAGVNTDFVDFGGSSSGHAIIQVNEKGQNCILLHKGANYELERPFIDRVLAQFGDGDILVLQNEINEMPYIINTAFEKGMRIALNPSPFTGEILNYPLHCITWLLLNEIEAQAISGADRPEEMLQELITAFPTAKIVLTIGKDGVMYGDDSLRLSHGIYDVPVVDTTAAGDTFTGFFISSVLAGKSPAEALRIASVASSLAVSRGGAAVSIPTVKEVLNSRLELVH